MSFLFAKSQLDQEIEKATSELLPSGADDVALSFEICDQIRGKQVPAKDAMRALKRRLEHRNPNVQMLALKLVDVCVKNGGHHFLLEIASKEFVDVLLALLRNDTTAHQVKTMLLQYLQSWALAFKPKPDLSYMYSTYMTLKSEDGWTFPTSSDDKLGGKAIMIDTAAPPEWTDSDACERCRSAFTFTNRKHHCRACGKTFCQPCSSKIMALPALGIKDEVRVCDGCYSKKGSLSTSSSKDFPGNAQQVLQPQSSDVTISALRREQDELEKAIALSLAQSQRPAYQQQQQPPQQPRHTEEESDPDIAAAIAASLAEMKTSHTPHRSSSLTTKNNNQTYNYKAAGYPPTSPRTSDSDRSSYTSKVIKTGDSITSNNSTVIKNPTELSTTEIENIELFAQLISRLEQEAQRNPQSSQVIQNKEIQTLYQQISSLHPRLLQGLHDAITKHRQFLDLHTKMNEATKQYNAVLEARLEYVKSGGNVYNGNGGQLTMNTPTYSNTYMPPQNNFSYGQPTATGYGGYGGPGVTSAVTTAPMPHAPSPPPAGVALQYQQYQARSQYTTSPHVPTEAQHEYQHTAPSGYSYTSPPPQQQQHQQKQQQQQQQQQQHQQPQQYVYATHPQQTAPYAPTVGSEVATQQGSQQLVQSQQPPRQEEAPPLIEL